MSYIQCRDYNAFMKVGIADEYESAGNYNLFMICENPNKNAFRNLPDGYHFRLCRRDELDIWKRVITEEQYIDYVTDYYNRVYAKHEDEFFRKCTFVCNSNDIPIASCFIWHAYDRVNTVAWFRVLPEYEGMGIGRALLSHLLDKTSYPVYLHTQPTSVCAIKLYSDFGFKLIKNPIIGHRTNNLSESLPYLQKVMNKSDFENLRFTETPDDRLHNAALLSDDAEF